MGADEEDGPLRWERFPIGWDAYDAGGDDAVVRVRYVTSGSHRGLAEVVMEDSDEAVAITLYERVLVGTHPDGAISAQTADAIPHCVEIALPSALRGRPLVDGSSGRRARRRPAGDGCPRWVP